MGMTDESICNTSLIGENGDLDPTACLLIKLLATSKQVLGSHHNVTKEVELELQEDDEDNAFVCHTKI